MACLTWSFQFFLLQLLLLYSHCHAKLCSEDQSSILLQFKQLFSHKNSSSYCDQIMVPSYPKMLSWKEDTDCCSWDGVTCDMETGLVIGLDLSCSCLVGNIPSNSSLFLLPHLKSLKLAFNDFSHSNISSSFNLFPDLELLNLSYSNFSGQIPLEISHLSKLVSLDLSSNSEVRLESHVWEGLVQNLTRLEGLALDYVDMSPIIPGSLANLSSSLTSLSITDCGLRGNFPDDIFRLPNLQTLNISSNSNLKGIFPKVNWTSSLKVLDVSHTNFSGELPDSIGEVMSLMYLDLSNCNFEGLVPSSLSNLTQLIVLVLANNKFSGDIPSSLSKLEKLNVLHLPGNNFIGQVPYTFVNLTQLSFLSLANNQLVGPIPSYLSRLQNLFTIDLYDNLLSGSIPSGLFTLPRVNAIDLGYNQLTGHLIEFHSNSLQNLFLDSNRLDGSIPVLSPYLTIFLVSNNKLSGEIPHSICNMSVIEVLDLSNNSLSGTIPKCIVNFSSSIRVLDLHKNRFYGRIPDTFAKGNVLRTLSFNGNQLEGSLPRSLENCRSLALLDLGNNNITDTFPYWLGSLPKLQILVLGSNKFNGIIQGSSKGNHSFTTLRIIDISNNNFEGSLPSKYFENLKAMMNVSEAERSLTYMGEEYFPDSILLTIKGLDTEYEKILYTFTFMDFSNNKFFGEIPESIGNLHALRFLNLSRNSLVGHIPSLIENLMALESLDLSSNKFVGEIPWQLTRLNFLQVLNLSNNQLTGPIPRGNHFDTFPNDSYSGNLGLCGFPLSKECDNDKKTLPSSTLEDGIKPADGFGWKPVLMGYGCGTAVGIVIGYIVLSTGKPQWLIKIVEGKHHRKLR